jgi:hypothetical protein
VKLLDFGVAKAATSSVKTRTGTLKGKIAYMSPEQAKGGSVDRRSDVFSLGICLWEMLTTSRLFRGENDLATLQLIINEAPKKPSEVNPEVPKDLERIVLRALAQDPKQRYQTAHELQAELEEFVRTQQMMQSTSALGMYMSVLFQPEIAALKDAKAAGTALSEHLTQVHENKVELTTPISDSEFIEPAPVDDDEEPLEDEVEDDLDQAAISGTIETKEAWPRRAPHAAPAIAPHTSSGPIPIGKAGSTPVVRASAPSLGPVIAPTLPPRKDPTRPPPSPVGPRATPSAPMPAIARTLTPPSVPILVHPTPAEGMQRPSWPPGVMNVGLPAHDGLPFSEEQAQRMRKQFYRIGGAVLGMLFLIAIIKSCVGGSGESPAKSPPAATKQPEVTPPSPPDARVEQPAIPDAGIATPSHTEPTEVIVTPDADVTPTTDAGSGSGTTKKKDTHRKQRTNTSGTYDLPTPPKRNDPRRK